MPRLEKFLKKSNLDFSSQNQIEKDVGLEEVDAPERKRVPRRSRFMFGCHRSRLTQIEEREREKETIRKVPIKL